MRPQHDKADYWISKGIFANLKSFSDLENRINALEVMKDEGDVFEIFVEGLLATQSITQCEKHWVVGKIPTYLRNKYNLPDGVLGIDGIYLTKDQKITAYQVKYRRNSHLTFTEVAPFLGVTGKFDDNQKLIFTNAQSLSQDAKIRSRWFSKSDFYDLSEKQIEEIISWICNEKIIIENYKPDPRYQIQALNDIEDVFRNYSRATAILACGTGKTLIGLWASERQKSKSVLVLVPSLTLLQQTLKQWSTQNNLGDQFSYLCVCSDVSVDKGVDNLKLNVNDVGFRVDTDPKVVKEFLNDRNDRVKIIFSTYNSSPVVGAGAQGFTFDFAIFDEAHKTTGIGDTYFTYALYDKNVQIKKRLFMTATPRHIDISKRNKDGDFSVKSMDNEEIYGPKAHHLSFRSATKKEIICDYKVIISVIDKSMIDDYSRKMGYTIIDYDEVSTRALAEIIALKQAIEKVNARKIISFHSRVKKAADFASSGVNGISKHLDNFSIFHVNGEQKASDRQEIIRNFDKASHTILTNARCLTEGIDVPAIDMVAFIDPRASKIDITQAIGRAMRKPRNNVDKKFGYILVPLFVDNVQENIDDVIKSEGFQHIADVINALRENDEELAQTLSQLKEDKGFGKGLDNSIIKDRLEFIGPLVDFNNLINSVTAAVVDRLTPSWDEWYGLLKKYFENEGHSRVPIHFSENKFNLGVWVQAQRQNYKNLSPIQRKKLENLNFILDVHDEIWNVGYNTLKLYKLKFNHCLVSRRFVLDNFKLGEWVVTQRRNFNKLSIDRKNKLDELDFVWDPKADDWNIGFEYLKIFYFLNNHCQVPIGYSEDNFKLGIWVRNQRRHFHKISSDRQSKLIELGFVSEIRIKIDWNYAFNLLSNFKNEFGHCDVPINYIRDSFNLGRWVSAQRKNRNSLSAEKIIKLNKIDFKWDLYALNFSEGLQHIIKFKTLNGHCRVPQGLVQDGYKLGNWVAYQRSIRNELSLDRIDKLNQIGFIWDPNESSWEYGFCQLLKFQSVNGHCRVSASYEIEGYKLGNWVSYQRKRKNILNKERKRKLDEIGFVWDTKSNEKL